MLRVASIGAGWTLAAAVTMLAAVVPARAQAPRPANSSPSPVERLGADLLRVGRIQVDTGKREISATGAFTGVSALEFIAVVKGGLKAYESLIELDTNAIDFNVALILIGLDPAHGSVPKMHFDPNPPKGDPVELWLEWSADGTVTRVRAEQLIYNEVTKQVMNTGPWVYTGSAFSTENNAYLAEIEGTLIGFVHTPAPVIENPRPIPESAYGNNIMNPAFTVAAGTSVKLTVKALAAGR